MAEDNGNGDSKPAPAPAKSAPARSTTTVAVQGDTRLIVALVGAATGFALISHEIQQVSGTSVAGAPKPTSTHALSTGGRIILGGFAATALLALLSHAGDPGRQLAVGLAVITAATSLLVYGGPVWKALANVVGNQPGAQPTRPTKPTQPTSATKGAALIATQAA